jgi:hypothetical protein
VISRILMSATIALIGLNGLFPDPPAEPVALTASQIMAKGKQRSISNLCAKKKKSKKVQQICSKWEEGNA